jgi:hypothetical protein
MRIGGPSKSSGVRLVAPGLRSVFKAAGALAISLASITPSWLVSSARKTGGNGRRPCGPPWRPGGGPPLASGAPGPGPLSCWAMITQVEAPSANMASTVFVIVFMI